jgi:histidine triad (HIT) family protein
MATIFSKIIAGEIPCYKIAEDDSYLAFLDISPLKAGHTLVIPKQEINYIFDMDDNELSGLIIFAKKVAKAIEKAIPCERIGVTIIGLEVPHAHIHLIPIETVSDINFSKQKLTLDKEVMADIAAKISAQVVL